jgi:CspA family cold shock protein
LGEELYTGAAFRVCPRLRHPARPQNAAEINPLDRGTKIDNQGLGAVRPEETRMPSGTIKRLVRDRGFGFIRDDGGQEWFFHRSSVQGSFDQLNEGQRVSFEEEPSAKGPRAGNVRGEAA